MRAKRMHWVGALGGAGGWVGLPYTHMKKNFSSLTRTERSPTHPPAPPSTGFCLEPGLWTTIRLMPTKKSTLLTYHLRVTLLDISPPIWRRVQVASTIPLCCLHDALQAVMGWTDSHLHQFERDGKYWGNPGYYEEKDLDVVEEGRTPIHRVLRAEGNSDLHKAQECDTFLPERQFAGSGSDYIRAFHQNARLLLC